MPVKGRFHEFHTVSSVYEAHSGGVKLQIILSEGIPLEQPPGVFRSHQLSSASKARSIFSHVHSFQNWNSSAVSWADT